LRKKDLSSSSNADEDSLRTSGLDLRMMVVVVEEEMDSLSWERLGKIEGLWISRSKRFI
jgi:hypothetical protein